MALCRAEIAHLVSSLICCLFETFRWDLNWDVLFETFETWVAYLKLSDDTWKRGAIWNFWNMGGGGLLIWNFQMRLGMRCAIWNFWNLKLFKLFNSSQKLVIWNVQTKLEMRCAIWNFSIFSNLSWELLRNFQMRLETRYAIWNVWNVKLFKHVMGVACLKLSDENWKRGAF